MNRNKKINNERSKIVKVPYQLLKIVLNGVWVNHDTYSYQSVEGEVKDLVAEKWNNPSSMLL